MNYKINHFEELDSTNTYCKNNIDQLNDLEIIECDYQTLGRGRMNRSFFATNDSLTFSIVYKNQFVLDHFDSLSLISAVAVYETLSKYTSNVSLKWPNDVLINGKKVSGILLESVSKDVFSNVILGIGVNINNSSFPEELNATSLYLETKQKFDKKVILDSILKSIDKHLENLKVNNLDYLKIFKEHNYLLNKDVYATIDNKEELVKIIDILDDNRLLVKVDDKVIKLSTGEITFHKNSH